MLQLGFQVLEAESQDADEFEQVLWWVVDSLGSVIVNSFDPLGLAVEDDLRRGVEVGGIHVLLGVTIIRGVLV